MSGGRIILPRIAAARTSPVTEFFTKALSFMVYGQLRPVTVATLATGVSLSSAIALEAVRATLQPQKLFFRLQNEGAP